MPGYQKASYWSGVIKEWEGSHQTQSVFCKEREISYHAFSYWRTRLNKQNRTASKPSFIKVIPNSSKQKKRVMDEGLTIWVSNSVRMIIKAPTDITLAASLVKALEE